MQTKQIIYVVGDNFANFAHQHARAITFSEFKLRAASAREENLFLPGQGLQSEQLSAVYIANTRGGMFLVSEGEIATRRETHKHEPKNTMVSLPRRVAPKKFELDLWIDGRNEVLSDHQTGQHVQGIALIEGARQSLLAVTEHFDLSPGDSSDFIVVWSGIADAEFPHFTFPLPIKINYEVLSKEVDRRGQMKFEVFIDFEQAGRTTACLLTSFAAYRKGFILGKEHEQACDTLDAMCQASSWSEAEVVEGQQALPFDPPMLNGMLTAATE
ncbi:MAG: AfsA-related hotdog domain-containing protein [Planctomycetota bacterium]